MKTTIFIFAALALQGCADPELVKKKKEEQVELKTEQAILEEVLTLQNKPDTLKFGFECGKAARSGGNTCFEITFNYTSDMSASKPFPGVVIFLATKRKSAPNLFEFARRSVAFNHFKSFTIYHKG